MLHRRFWLLVSFVLCAAPPAAAQDNPAYQSAYERGDQAFKEGRFDVCAEEFRQAFNIEPRGNLLYNIGFCYEKANDLANAVTFYQRFVEAVPNSPKRPAIQRHIVELQEQIADLFQEVSVTSDPTGAMVYVDEKSKGAMGATPLTFKLLPGTYTIIGEFQGYEPARKKLELKKGGDASVDLTLVDSRQVGTVTVMITERDADVLVDNKKVGKSPLPEPLRLKRGPHEIQVTKNGFASFKQSVEVEAGKSVTVKAELSSGAEGADSAVSGGPSGGGAPLFTGPRLLPTITMGVGLLTIGGGVVTALSASKLHGQLEDKQKKGELIAPQDIDTGNSRVLMTNVLWGAGGALLAGGAVWWFLAGSGGNAASGEIGFSVAPSGSALVWGSF